MHRKQTEAEVIADGIAEGHKLGEQSGNIQAEIRFIRIVSSLLEELAGKGDEVSAAKRSILMELWQRYVTS